MFTQANGDRRNVDNVLMIITDGSSNDHEITIREAREVKKAGIHIFVEAKGNWYNLQEMHAMASHPYSKNFFQLRRWTNFDSDFRSTMRNLFCNSKLLEII